MDIQFKKFLNEKLNALKIPKFEYHTNIKLVLEADDENESDLSTDTANMESPTEPDTTDIPSSNDDSIDNSR